MDNLRVLTVLGAFNHGGNNSGADLSHGGSIDGDLTVSGKVSAGQGEFDNLQINGKNIADMLAAANPPKAPVPIADAQGKLKDGYRYLVQPIDDCTEIVLGGITVCQYAQAELWVDNRSSALEVYYPSEWLWRDGNEYVLDCGDGVIPQSQCGYMQVITVRHDGQAVLANQAYEYKVAQTC